MSCRHQVLHQNFNLSTVHLQREKYAPSLLWIFNGKNKTYPLKWRKTVILDAYWTMCRAKNTPWQVVCSSMMIKTMTGQKCTRPYTPPDVNYRSSLILCAFCYMQSPYMTLGVNYYEENIYKLFSTAPLTYMIQSVYSKRLCTGRIICCQAMSPPSTFFDTVGV